MKLGVKFSESCQSFNPTFGESNQEFPISIGEFTDLAEGERKQAYYDGYKKGYGEGYADGLAARTYETWTITLADGTIIEKEVALL